MTIKANIFYYAITGGILSFYFSKPNEQYLIYSLVFPIIMSLMLGIIFIYSSNLIDVVRNEMFFIRNYFGFLTAPEFKVLKYSLRAFGVLSFVVAVCLIILFFLKNKGILVWIKHLAGS
jgi:hypothetical protein